MALEDEGNERATIRLVSEQVKSVEKTVLAGFADLQRQITAVAALPERFAAFKGAAEAEFRALHDRVQDLEEAAKEKSARFPMLLLVGVGTVFTGLGVVLTYVALHHP